MVPRQGRGSKPNSCNTADACVAIRQVLANYKQPGFFGWVLGTIYELGSFGMLLELNGRRWTSNHDTPTRSPSLQAQSVRSATSGSIRVARRAGR
jgi:hypothetical protein